MHSELRVYTISPGAMDAWVAEWLEHVVPLRQRFGFHVPQAWVADGDRFVWVLAYDGDDYAVADEAYHASEDRRAVEPEPSRHVEHAEFWSLRPVL